MNNQDIKNRLRELHKELCEPFRFRSKKDIMDEAKNVKLKLLQIDIKDTY